MPSTVVPQLSPQAVIRRHLDSARASLDYDLPIAAAISMREALKELLIPICRQRNITLPKKGTGLFPGMMLEALNGHGAFAERQYLSLRAANDVGVCAAHCRPLLPCDVADAIESVAEAASTFSLSSACQRSGVAGIKATDPKGPTTWVPALDDSNREEARRLLARGLLTPRQVAVKLGVSLKSVRQVQTALHAQARATRVARTMRAIEQAESGTQILASNPATFPARRTVRLRLFAILRGLLRFAWPL
jgi:hypothetical protein